MRVIEEQCPICEEVYPYHILQKCIKCGRLCCINCIIRDENGDVVCLDCARKMVTPRIKLSKYAALSIYLARRAKYRSRLILTFPKIEEIIGDSLPYSAFHYKGWWSNVRGRSPSEAWMTVGWRVESVNLEKMEVTFIRDKGGLHEEERNKGKNKRKTKLFKKILHKKRTKRRREPSKTKIAIAQARLKNIERIKAQSRRYRGKFKPRSAHEKRLYKH